MSSRRRFGADSCTASRPSCTFPVVPLHTLDKTSTTGIAAFSCPYTDQMFTKAINKRSEGRSCCRDGRVFRAGRVGCVRQLGGACGGACGPCAALRVPAAVARTDALGGSGPTVRRDVSAAPCGRLSRCPHGDGQTACGRLGGACVCVCAGLYAPWCRAATPPSLRDGCRPLQAGGGCGVRAAGHIAVRPCLACPAACCCRPRWCATSRLFVLMAGSSRQLGLVWGRPCLAGAPASGCGPGSARHPGCSSYGRSQMPPRLHSATASMRGSRRAGRPPAGP